MGRFTGLLGILAVLLAAWLGSTDRRRIRWRTVAWGLGLQVTFAFLVLRFDYGQRAATTTAQCDGSVLLFDGEVVLRLRASVPLTVDDREVRTSFSLREVMSLHSYSTSRRRRTTKAPYVLRRRSGYSTSPSPSGESGSPKAPTAADGAKRSNGRH